MKKVYFDPTFLNRYGGIGTDSRGIFDNLKSSKFEVDTTPLELRYENSVVKSLAKVGLNRFIKFLPFKFSSLDLVDHELYFSPQIGSPPPGSKFLGTWIVRVHDLFPLTNPEWFRPWSVYGFKQGIKSIQYFKPHLLFNSQTTLNEFIKIFPDYDQRKLLLLPCSIPTFDNLNACNKCQGCAIELPNRKYLISIGTIEPRKNYDHLIKNYLKSKSELELIIIGNYGWKSRSTQRLLKKSPGVIWIRGACSSSVGKLLKSATIFISDSLDEGFNLPIFEARNFEVPIFLSKVAVHLEFHQDVATFFAHSELTSLLENISLSSLKHSHSAVQRPVDIYSLIEVATR
jgi:glycosyltransferase involved in cell wall biosynthesis